MRSIAAPGLLLEPLLASHAHDMFAVLADPAIYEFENSAPPSEAWLHERYQRLQLRGPADGSELWLNWVIRLDTQELAGYVQATVMPGGRAFIAYELNSRFWRRGIGGRAVGAMLATLGRDCGVRDLSLFSRQPTFGRKACC